MRKILVFKIPAKLVLEAAGRKIEEEKKSFESRVKSHKLHKVIHPKYYKNSIEPCTFAASGQIWVVIAVLNISANYDKNKYKSMYFVYFIICTKK